MSNIDKKVDINAFVNDWNTKYPYDRWWRKRYNVPFGSRSHREASFIDMVVEYIEDITYRKSTEDEEDDIDGVIDANVDKTYGDKTVVKMKKSELDDEFDNIDLDNFNG